MGLVIYERNRIGRKPVGGALSAADFATTTTTLSTRCLSRRVFSSHTDRIMSGFVRAAITPMSTRAVEQQRCL